MMTVRRIMAIRQHRQEDNPDPGIQVRRPAARDPRVPIAEGNPIMTTRRMVSLNTTPPMMETASPDMILRMMIIMMIKK